MREYEEGFAELFKLLSESSRLRILFLLIKEECCVGDIADKLGMNQSAVSHQLRVLKDQGIISARREGKQIYYALTDTVITLLFEAGEKCLDKFDIK